MWLFDKFRKKNNANSEQVDFSNCIEIAKIISENDEQVIKEIIECVANPVSYYNTYESEYSERGILDSNDIDTIIWIGLVNCLIRNNYVCERDYNDELDDFIYFMNNLKYNVTFDKGVLNENGSIVEWCTKLDEVLQLQNLCIGDIDIDSDSYVMFICEKDKLEQLNRLALNINRKITLASKS